MKLTEDVSITFKNTLKGSVSIVDEIDIAKMLRNGYNLAPDR